MKIMFDKVIDYNCGRVHNNQKFINCIILKLTYLSQVP